jgi:DNA-binding Lrp family transcriptional regulator
MDSNVVPITQNNTPVVDTTPEFLVLKFADSRIPVFKESRNKDYIKYGDDNLYPDYLTYLFNKSAKHGAIIGGKAFYIFGEGYENGDIIVNRLGETLNDIAKKSILDIEIYGGYRWEIIWNAARKVAEIYHVDYTTIRVGKNGGYYFKECWDANNRDEEIFMPAFNPNTPFGSQLYAYNEYRPKTRFYPLPEYIGSNNFIETDIEISKYYLSAIRNGMTPSKMIQFFQGEPTEDKKREIEHRMAKKFAGAENAGKFLLVFNAVNASRSVEVNDLSATDLDKHMIELNKTCQQEIFSGHRVTSPMLFGIKTEGQLGGNTELKASYELFVATYAKPKANAFDKELNYILNYSSKPGKYELRQTDPIGWQVPEALLSQAVSPDDVREKLGLPIIEKSADNQATRTLNAINGMSPLVANKILEKLTDNEIRGLAGLPTKPGGDVLPVPEGGAPAVVEPTLDSDEPIIPINENIKNLSGKQQQNIERIVKKYKQGKITLEVAKHMLQTGYGLSDKDINIYLGIQPVVMSADEEEEYIVGMFDEYGDTRDDYEIIKSKKVCFNSELEAEEDEAVYIQEAFKTLDVTRTENEILNLLRKDPKITPKVIAETIGQTEKYVASKLQSLIKRGYIETATELIGDDEIISRTIPESVDIVPPALLENPPVQVMVKYSYEVKPNIGPAIIPTSRPFCRKMIALNRLYSRADIEKISVRLGYSVFDRKGGWWGKSPECRHIWKSNIVVRKK